TVTAVSLKQLQIEYLAPAPKAVENPEAKDGAAEQSEENIYVTSKSSPGNVQLYMAAESAKNRKTKAEVANKTFEIYQKTADSVWSAEDKEEKAKLCTELKSLLDRAFPEAEHAMLDALSDEEKQLKMIRKAYLIAERRGGKLPEGDMDAIIRRRAELASGHPYSQVKEEIAACRKTVEGMVSFLEGDVDAAVSAMAEAELLSPDSLYALIYRGILHQKQGDYKISRTCWSKALAVDPKNKSLRTALKSLPE
ncbi:tetratricopeptide repeat protein, partial [Myxococcota bacterium]|nr:tetratricopeptide repeat protein [Myxococcota bacterium]